MLLDKLYDKNSSRFLPVFESVDCYTGLIDPLVRLPKLRTWEPMVTRKSMDNINHNFQFSRFFCSHHEYPDINHC